jgi:Enolase C-terminal domain-like
MEIDALDSEGGPALDAERIAACQADKRSGEFFLVDANGGLLQETALRMLRMLPPGLDFVLEAPCATWRETISLRQRCPYPIVIDELAQQDDDIALASAHDIADGIGLKVSKAGGLTRGRRHRDMCRSAGMTVSVQDTVGSAIAFAAIVQLGATVPPRTLRCVLNCEDGDTADSEVRRTQPGRRHSASQRFRPWYRCRRKCAWRASEHVGRVRQELEEQDHPVRLPPERWRRPFCVWGYGPVASRADQRWWDALFHVDLHQIPADDHLSIEPGLSKLGVILVGDPFRVRRH